MFLTITTLSFLIDFKKLFNKKIISPFIWIFTFCFLFPLESNPFICSYLNSQLFNIEENIIFIFLSFILYILYSYIIYSFNFYKNYINKIINNYMSFQYLNFCNNFIDLYYSIFLYIKSVYINICALIYIYIYNLYSILIKNIILYIKDSNLVWYPIYKSYSIFGYYKSTRLKFIDLKNENFKNLKY